MGPTCFLFSLLIWAASPATLEKGMPSPTASVAPAIAAIATAQHWLEQALAAYEKVEDYTTFFLKQERIGNRLRKEDRIELKFQKPFKLYMAWIESPDKGMEVIYVQGENDNKIIAHLGGFLNTFIPTVDLDIHDTLATRNNRHVITETGMGMFLTRYEADFKQAKERQELQILLHGDEKVYGRTVHTVEALLPKKPNNGYYCYRSVVRFDVENKLPIQMEFYDHANTLLERYGYQDLKLNPNLTAKDFDPNNERYNF